MVANTGLTPCIKTTLGYSLRCRFALLWVLTTSSGNRCWHRPVHRPSGSKATFKVQNLTYSSSPKTGACHDNFRSSILRSKGQMSRWAWGCTLLSASPLVSSCQEQTCTACGKSILFCFFNNRLAFSREIPHIYCVFIHIWKCLYSALKRVTFTGKMMPLWQSDVNFVNNKSV